jgi:hypothetical protein
MPGYRRRRETTSAAPRSRPASEAGEDGALPPAATLHPAFTPGPPFPAPPSPALLLPVPLLPAPVEPPVEPAPPTPNPLDDDDVLPDPLPPVPEPAPAPLDVVALPLDVVALPLELDVVTPPLVLDDVALPPPEPPDPPHGVAQSLPRQALRAFAAASVVHPSLMQVTQFASLTHASACAQHDASRHASQLALPVVSPQPVPPLLEVELVEVELVEVELPELPPLQASGYVPLGSEPPGAATQA